MPVLLRDFPVLRIIRLTMYAESHLVETFRQLGVHGYLLKNVNHRELLTSLRLVCDGGYYFDPTLTNPQQSNLHTDDAFVRQFQLNPRELEILRCVYAGLSSRQIAEKLHLSYLTVKSHRRNIHHKLRTDTTVESIQFARNHGL